MKRRDVVVSLVMTVFILFSFSIFFFVNDSMRIRLGEQDGFFDTLGAIGLFIGSVLLSVQFWRDHSGNDLFLLKTRKNYFLLFTAILFFFGAGEEISWGQSFLHFKTPDYFHEHNVQDEITIHNLEIFNSTYRHNVEKTGLAKVFTINFLFNIYWSLYCIVIPLANKFSHKVSSFLRRINLPLIPIWMGILFIVTYVLTKLTETHFTPPVSWGIGETKECDFELLLVLAALLWFLEARNEVLKSNGPLPTRQ